MQKRLATVPPDIPDVHPNIAGIYARKVTRLAEALEKPDERDAAASAIQGLIERIVLTPDADGLHVTLKGDFGAILEWTGNGAKKEVTDTPGSGMSVSVVAGERYLTQAQGRYGIMALDRNGNGVAWKYCAGYCQVLTGNQNNAIKSQWALQAIASCEEAARRHDPTVKPDCDVYAIKDEIVWKHAFPWTVGDKTFYDYRKRLDAAQK